MNKRCPITSIQFVKKETKLKKGYERVPFDESFDLTFSKHEKSAPLTSFQISQDIPCMSRKDTFSSDRDALALKFFQRQEFENSLFLENDEYYIENDG